MILFTPSVLEFFKTELSSLSGNYLEIGVYNGLSLKELGLLYPNKKIIGIDPFIEDGCTSHNSKKAFNEHLDIQKNNTLNNIQGIPNIELYEMTSDVFFKNNVDRLYEFDVSAIFIDGSHHYKDVTNDYKLSMALLNKKGGVICFDDLQVPDVILAVEEFEILERDRIVEKKI
jgi:hypothetical protein